MRIFASLGIIVLLLLSSCTSIIEGGIRDSILGSWEAISMTDADTEEVTVSPLNGFTVTMENRFCDSFTLDTDDTFTTYYQDGGNTVGSDSGEWTVEFGELTMNFDDGTSWIRSFAVSADILEIPDTINGNAVTINYSKVQ